MKIKLEKKNIFFLGDFEKSAKIHIKKSFSNIFITLTDLNDKVIICYSSGSSMAIVSKKQKASPYAVEAIVKKLLLYLRLYNIKNLQIILKLKVSSHVFFLIKELNFYGFTISNIFEKKSIPHNGVRSRKAPRK
jgi:ribosomal protein S11